MRDFFAKVAAVIAAVSAAMSRFTWALVREGGKLVMRLVPSRPVAEPPVTLPTASAESDDMNAIRCAAGVLAMGQTQQAKDLVGISEARVAWLRALDRRQLCIILSRRDDELKAHLNGTAKVPGLPSTDPATVAALVEAKKPKPTQRGYRTLRDRLAELKAERDDEPTSTWALVL